MNAPYMWMRGQMSDFRTTCICPDAWCPVHAMCLCGAHMIIDDPESPAFCPDCLMDRMPAGACHHVARPEGGTS